MDLIQRVGRCKGRKTPSPPPPPHDYRALSKERITSGGIHAQLQLRVVVDADASYGFSPRGFGLQ